MQLPNASEQTPLTLAKLGKQVEFFTPPSWLFAEVRGQRWFYIDFMSWRSFY